MKTLITILLFCGFAFGQGSEIKRPTSDTDPGSSTWATTNCGIGSYTANSTAGTLARDASGQSTSITYNQAGTLSLTKIASRVFSVWDSTANTYSALTLNVNSKSSANSDSIGGKACVTYSIDAGGTWTAIRCAATSAGWTQATDPITLSASQNLSRLRVGVCMLGQNGGTATDGSLGLGTVQLYDIWTVGTLSAAAAGNGSGAGNGGVTAVQAQ